MAGYESLNPCTPTLLAVNTVVNFNRGAIGSGGAANDTVVLGIKILKNAGAATCTFNSGFRDQTGAQNTTAYVFSGSTTADVYIPLNWINTAGALQVTAAVANTVIIETAASGYVP
jgi:hypothetical protein